MKVRDVAARGKDISTHAGLILSGWKLHGDKQYPLERNLQQTLCDSSRCGFDILQINSFGMTLVESNLL